MRRIVTNSGSGRPPKIGACRALAALLKRFDAELFARTTKRCPRNSSFGSSCLDFRRGHRTSLQRRQQEITCLMNLTGRRATRCAFGHVQDVHRRAPHCRTPLDTRTFNYSVRIGNLCPRGTIEDASIFPANVRLRLNEYAPFPHRPEATTIVAGDQHRDANDRSKAHATDDPLQGVLFPRGFDHVGQPQDGTASTFGKTDERQQALSHLGIVTGATWHQIRDRINNDERDIPSIQDCVLEQWQITNRIERATEPVFFRHTHHLDIAKICAGRNQTWHYRIADSVLGRPDHHTTARTTSSIRPGAPS
ncbi:hypothetical protein X977_4931 [Burkholderia pseudomallei MSHR7504]|nr:hypothetical protein X977_4931 [Burkholderia pseudomallei MSHR7504]